MEIYQVIILSIIQGISEISPISSYTFLNAIPWIFNWTKIDLFSIEYKSFIIALYIGTILALLLCFYKEWKKLILAGYNQIKKKEKTPEGKIFVYMAVGVIPGGILLFILYWLFGRRLATPLITGILTLIFGILLAYIDRKNETTVTYDKLTLKQSFLLGFSQCLSFIPGLSSVTTSVLVGRKFKMNRKNILKYSFMLLLPITIVNLIIQCFYTTTFKLNLQMILGTIITFMVTVLFINVFLEYVEKKTFKVFVNCRIVLGIIILLIWFFRSDLLWICINSFDPQIYKALVKLLY